MKVRFKKLSPQAIVPTYAHNGDACFDIYALGDMEKPVDIRPGGAAAIPTGISFEVPIGYVMLVFSRSGHGFKHGVRLGNAVGVIDAGYRGELQVALHNDGRARFKVAHGDRIAQAMIIPRPVIELEEAGELSDTSRGAGGLGSTGA